MAAESSRGYYTANEHQAENGIDGRQPGQPAGHFHNENGPGLRRNRVRVQTATDFKENNE